MKIISVVGARPNFMKIAPFIKAIKDYNESLENLDLNNNNYQTPITHILVHTGQHYDDSMSKSFFDQLELPQPDINLGIGSGTHAEQVGITMIEFEKVLKLENPDWVVVVGDVNAILACSITAKKEHIKCCHIEAGLRSGDLNMPEEINRLVADRISDLLLTPDHISSKNLLKEGVSPNKIKLVGNIMIDTLEAQKYKAYNLDINQIIKTNAIKTPESPDGETLTSSSNIDTSFYPPEKLWQEELAVLTIHRPSNVDDKKILEPILNFISSDVCNDRIVIWPVHPRTKKRLLAFGLFSDLSKIENLILLEPISYLEMLRLNLSARIMITDSGGLQEECTVLGTPCLTLRWNTERPVTLVENGGVSILVGNIIEKIRNEYYSLVSTPRKPFRPEFWDGNTAKRCLDAILDFEN